jgi:hypothetical protein
LVGDRRITPAAILGLLFLFAGIAGCGRSHPLARKLASAQFVQAPENAAQFLEQMVVQTPFEGNLVINAVPDSAEGLAVFFLSPKNDWRRLGELDGRFSYLKDNCGAFPGENTIACDASFLRGFLQNHLSYPLTESRERTFLLWVLGHELGHIALRQGGGHFTPPTDLRRSLRSLESQRREYAADCWMFRQFFARDQREEVVALESLAIDFINSRLLQTEGEPPAGVGILYDYNRLNLYDFLKDETHPDLLLRSARALHIATLWSDDPGLTAMVSRFSQRLVQDPLWKEQGPCGPAPSPERASSPAPPSRR